VLVVVRVVVVVPCGGRGLVAGCCDMLRQLVKLLHCGYSSAVGVVQVATVQLLPGCEVQVKYKLSIVAP
jgi:hypothetical protein